MAVNQITTEGSGNQLSGQARTFYRRVFIDELTPKLTYNRFGMADHVPLREGRTIQWSTMGAVPDGEALLESAAGTAGAVTTGSISATLADYGKYFQFSSRVSMEAPDPVLETFVMRMAAKARRNLDSYTRDVLSASTNITYTGSNVADGTIGAGDIMDLASLKAVRNGFIEADVDPITSYLMPDGGSGTVPGEESHIAIAHAHVISDLRDNAAALGFTPVSNYQHANDIFEGEVGKTDGIRWINAGSAGKLVADAGSGNVDVYHTHIFGADAFGVVDLDNRPANIWFVPHNEADSGNPLGRVGSVGWTAEHAAAITEPLALQVIHSSSSYGANS